MEDLKVLDEVKTVYEEDVFTSKTGVKVKISRVNRLIVLDAVRRIKDPKVPVVYIESKNRSEDNPSDPDYIAAKQQADLDRGMTTINVYLAFGTKPIYIPDTKEKPGDTGWSKDYEEVGLDIPEKGRGRYTAWLKYYALLEDEVNELSLMAMRYSGATLEEDVNKSVTNFQSN